MKEITSQPGKKSSTAMTETAPPPPATAPTLPDRPLDGTAFRLWPALLIIVALWVIKIVPVIYFSEDVFLLMIGAMYGPMLGAVGLVIWWTFFSRLPWSHVFAGLLSVVGVGMLAWSFNDPTMDMMVLILFALPVVLTLWVLWLLVTPFLRGQARIVGLFLVFVVTWGMWNALWFKGTNGEFIPLFGLRWEVTAERQLLASNEKAQGTNQQIAALNVGDWPAFRGANRDSVLPGVKIDTDWTANRPKELWKRKIGPGWSSFTVIGDLIYTQEQRGEEELVTCYESATGKLVWSHRNAGRFNEAIAGPGPRATPTYHDGKIYAFSANGRLDCLNATTGSIVWSRDVKQEAGAATPNWGFASSPLISQGTVSVFAAGAEGKAMMAYDASSGEPAWSAGNGVLGYCSPQPALIHGVEQLLINTENGTTSIEPRTGKVLWNHEWALGSGMARVVQPAQVGENDFLLGTFFGLGTQRVSVSKDGDQWSTSVTWHTKGFKPYYNDLVIFEGHLYGFDGAFFTCLSLDDGKSKWRVRGYGNGQVLLLKDQGLLLILSETGEVALVEASPSQHTELARIQGIEGKTWNHPVIAHGKLFIRNGEEAACFELTPAK